MLSRVANTLYWMVRYVERADNLARLIDVNQQLLLDFESLDFGGEFQQGDEPEHLDPVQVELGNDRKHQE